LMRNADVFLSLWFLVVSEDVGRKQSRPAGQKLDDVR